MLQRVVGPRVAAGGAGHHGHEHQPPLPQSRRGRPVCGLPPPGSAPPNGPWEGARQRGYRVRANQMATGPIVRWALLLLYYFFFSKINIKKKIVNSLHFCQGGGDILLLLLFF
jgi:hypothetical protein